jgi:predicted amidohydrolase YtcJ
MRRRSVLGLLAAVAVPGSGVAGDQPPPDLILHNGRVWTGDTGQPQAEAIAIRQGAIIGVGSDAGVLASRGPQTRTMDLLGRRVIPGVNDAHDHGGSAPPGVEVHTHPPAQANPPLSVLLDSLSRAAESAPIGTWLFATAGPAVMGNPAETLRGIDGIGTDHPIAIQAWWGHGLILNKVAQAWAGVSGAMPDPLGGWLDRDAQGRFTGRLDEYAGHAVWRRLSRVSPPEVHVRAFRAYAAQRLSQGVTSVQIMTTSQPPLALATTVSAAQAKIGVRLIHFVIPDEDGVKPLRPRRIDARTRIDGIKYVLDGTPIDQFAYQTADYSGRPNWRGRLNFDRAFIAARLKDALSDDQQLLFHVVGSASAGVVLDLMAGIAPAPAWATKRVRLEHANGIVGDNITRARDFGVVIAQGRPTSPYRSWLRGGVPVAYGSDTDFAPWMMFKAMTAPLNSENVTREEALTILTSGSAWSERMEHRKGRISPGYQADLAVLSQDVLTCPADALDQTTSVLTIVGGEIAHNA